MAKDDGPAKCYLTNIPIEVLLRITHHLTTTELGNVRLTCRALEQSLFHFFSHEFFRKKQFMVSDFSLQTLVDISKHPTLSQVLTHVIIATDFVTSYVHSSSVPSQRDALTDHRTAYEWLVSAGLLKDMLAEAFRNLPNLEIVDIRDFNAKSRSRDGTGTEWLVPSAAARPLLPVDALTVTRQEKLWLEDAGRGHRKLRDYREAR
jgi:hypothetical protein